MNISQAPRLPDRPFTLGEAQALGVSRDKLRSREFSGVSRNLYRPASWDFELRDAARALCVATPGAWISHTTAARLHELILPPWLSESNDLHLSKPRKLPGTRRSGIVGHTVVTLPGEVEFIDELRISVRSRTWLDLARTLPLYELICMGDQLIRIPRPEFEGRSEPFATLDQLRAMADRHKNLQGIVRAREALELMRVGADSGPETLMRLAMLDAGLPEPELQLKLWDGPKAPSADAGYSARRIALQYDGAHHLDEAQRHSDRRRDKAFGAAGWTVLVFTDEDLADHFQNAVLLIKQALRTSWVDPAIASGFTSSS
ncbi:hypothetical protein ART_2073 [Arthrobacter sp. PAMC 25486]|uniref:DUF559 domain-containing protein n=1 Tax=Arthrobacter sp. PAMC 25486 TaxID=1494608 RepID=UPI000535CF1B|nr:DUF559 domain-containing protein [Arthrobacter sp. PAMC 25486]AIY01672.1 hypothetical protein ART_2073 [Arthrobacter sp. PAMC 25486]